MKKNEFAVVLASDNRGILPLSVTVFSLLNTAGPETFYKIYVLSDGIDGENRASVERLAAPFDCRLDILYLDIDVLVCRDLTELFRTNMDGKAVGVVFENFSRPGSHFNERLEMPLTCTGYFNSGVLLMNVDVFRERNLVRAVLDYAVTHRDRLTCPDQDALNGALCELTVPLHPRWNWHDGLTRRILKNDPREQFWRGVTPRQAVEAALEPGILHYQGVHKPWRYNWRYEGERYERVMREAGLLRGPLPGRTLPAVLKKHLYRPVYRMTARKILRLKEGFDNRLL